MSCNTFPIIECAREIAPFGIDFLSLENTPYRAYNIMQFWNMPQLLLNALHTIVKLNIMAGLPGISVIIELETRSVPERCVN